MKELISIIVPCYNEEEALPIFYDAITPILTSIDADYEIILVDDGSKDNTPSLMKELSNKDNHVKYIIFSRNFGKEAAMYAGLEHAKGDYVAVMDVDLQDPPEKLVEMLKALKEEDYDCVATRRVTRAGEPKIRSWFARKFYKIINKWSQTEIVDGARDYRLMKRSMVDSILSLKEHNRFSKGIFSWVGYKTKWLEYENIERCAGETKWNFVKLCAYAIEGFIAFTLEPLYLIIKTGIWMTALDVLATIVLAILAACHVLFFMDWLIYLVLVFLFGLSFIFLGIVALYQAKIYTEVKNRPEYISRESNID